MVRVQLLNWNERCKVEYAESGCQSQVGRWWGGRNGRKKCSSF